MSRSRRSQSTRPRRRRGRRGDDSRLVQQPRRCALWSLEKRGARAAFDGRESRGDRDPYCCCRAVGSDPRRDREGAGAPQADEASPMIQEGQEGNDALSAQGAVLGAGAACAQRWGWTLDEWLTLAVAMWIREQSPARTIP